MKILVLSNYYPEHVGGIEFVAQNLVLNYRANGNHVRWIACDVPHTPHINHQDDHHLRCNNFTEDHLGFPYPLPGLKSLPTIYRDIFWCDVLHIHDCLYAANVLAFLLSRIQKKPVLITQHIAAVEYHQRYKNIFQILAYRFIGKMLIQRAERVVFITPVVREWFAQFASLSRPAIDLPNGCDTEMFYPIDAIRRPGYRQKLDLPVDRPVFIFVGRFIEKKGINIIRRLVIEHPNIYWVLIGRKGDDNPRLWKGDNFRVVDSLPQKSLREYYWAAHLLVLPSCGEGFPNVIQEAMACGTVPLVSCEIFDALRDPNAPLFRAAINHLAFSRQIEHILGNINLMDHMHSKVAQYAKMRWNWETTSKEYLRLLNQMQVEYS